MSLSSSAHTIDAVTSLPTPKSSPEHHKIRDLIVLCRPTHIVKNGLVLLPFFLSGFSSGGVASAIAFVCFSLMAMAVYALNDTLDALHDMFHPTKCNRPVASGRISEKEAFTLTACLVSLSIFISASQLGFEPTLLLIVYFVLNVFYSQTGKDLAIIDVTIVAAGFVLRYMIGLSVTETGDAAGWLVFPLFLAALCLAVGKRLAKMLRASSGTISTRISSFYTVARTTWLAIFFSNMAIAVLSVLTLKNWTHLTEVLSFSAFGLAVMGIALLCVWTRVLSGLLSKKTEPTELFTQDRTTVSLLLVAVSVMVLDVAV